MSGEQRTPARVWIRQSGSMAPVPASDRSLSAQGSEESGSRGRAEPDLPKAIEGPGRSSRSAVYGNGGAVGPNDAVIALDDLKWKDGETIKHLPGSSPWVLRAPAAAAALCHSDAMLRRWSRAGMLRPGRQPGSAEAWMASALDEDCRVYRISVFHLEPIAIHRIGYEQLEREGVHSSKPASASPAGRWSSVGSRHRLRAADADSAVGIGPTAQRLAKDPLLRRVARMAVRSVYTAGLDIGDAYVALSGDGRAAALTVAQPKAAGRDAFAQPWLGAMQQFASRYSAFRDAGLAEGGERAMPLIGADPEFVLLRTDGRIAPADRYLGVGGGAGSDALLIGQRLCYPIGELRPDPADAPEQLAANVRKQLWRADAMVGDRSLRWAAGAMPLAGVALGGHIHLSGVMLTSRLLRQMDRCIALPMAMVEPDGGRGRRPRYGALGDFRQQPHGGFEYRTLPSWLASPASAKAAFALTLLCARDTWRLPCKPVLDEREEAAFYAGDRAELAGSLQSIAEEISAAPSYEAYARWIEPLFEAARAGRVWDEVSDIRRKWRVGPYA